MAMQLYLAIDDQKTGPFTLFQVEEKLRAEEVTDDTLCWYEGVSSWTPLTKLAPFESFFRLRDNALEEEREREREQKLVEREAEAVSPESARPFTRLWARYIDLTLFISLAILLLVGLRAMNWTSLTYVDFVLRVMFPLFPVYHLLEAYMIARWATTPGKWLVGIQVTDAEGNLLDLGSSLRRSIGVFVVGLGCYFYIAPLITGVIAALSLKKRGRTFWDTAAGSRVEHQPLAAKHILMPILVLMVVGAFIREPMKEIQAWWDKEVEELQERKQSSPDEA